MPDETMCERVFARLGSQLANVGGCEHFVGATELEHAAVEVAGIAAVHDAEDVSCDIFAEGAFDFVPTCSDPVVRVVVTIKLG